MKELILLRGLPGAGKSTVANLFGEDDDDVLHFEADMYFMKNGTYQFDVTQIKDAHIWCQACVSDCMSKGASKLIVSNTFTQEWEMAAYYKLAEEYGYRVTALIVENRHGGENIHGVPTDKLEQMRNRFEIKL